MNKYLRIRVSSAVGIRRIFLARQNCHCTDRPCETGTVSATPGQDFSSFGIAKIVTKFVLRTSPIKFVIPRTTLRYGHEKLRLN